MNLLNEREKTHGDYSLVAAVSQALKSALRLGPYDELPAIHRESLELNCMKMARIVCGDHNEPDHWTDIMGYAKLVLKTLEVPSGSAAKEPPDEIQCNYCVNGWASCICGKRTGGVVDVGYPRADKYR